MRSTRRLALGLAILGTLLIMLGLATMVMSQEEAPTLPSTISGIVTTTDGKPAAGAIIQVQATENMTEADANGAFTLDGIGGTTPIIVVAWLPEHYVGWATLDPAAPDWTGGTDVSLTVKPLNPVDNSKYSWFSFEDVDGSASCGLCHREYSEWQNDQHSRSAVNHHFLNLYTGSDINGNVGPVSTFSLDGTLLPPDPDQPSYGPGFLLDNPGRAGNCASCHTPVASTTPTNQTCAWSGCHTNLTIQRANGLIQPPAYPINLRGDAAEGISCDFCHKIGDVKLDPETLMPYPDLPGIMSMRLYRPADGGQQVFFGTLIDVNRNDTYLPLLSESAFCSSCHFGVFGGVVGMQRVSGGTVIYNSYGEWLESPYSDPETGKTCQDCHMPVSDANWFVFPERGGLTRDYAELHNHAMPGAADENLLQNAVSMTTDAERDGDQLRVQVSITNDQTGHSVPTDAPIRSMILVVEALDADGNPLALSAGPVNPDYSGNFGGLPGKTFAKVLRDEWTGEAPTAAFWREVSIVEDSRLEALATDTTSYVFDAPAGADVTINVRLVFRRAFAQLMEQKGWDDPDILMEHETIQLPAADD